MSSKEENNENVELTTQHILASFRKNEQDEPMKKVEWSVENEKILVEWCDIAQCYKWLNMKAHNAYSYLNAWFTIPAIILSTISGTASFAQESIPTNYKSMATLIIGTVNIGVGILATIQQFLKISELNEAHRVGYIAWDKYARNIRIELSKAPNERPEANMFLKYCRDEFDRLMETSPPIPESTIALFKSTFLKSKDVDVLAKVKKLKLPDICDIIVSAEETRHHWYKNIKGPLTSDVETNIKEDIVQRLKEMREKEQNIQKMERELKRKENTIKHSEKHKIEKYTSMVHEFQEKFEKTHGRRPEKSDIIEHFDGTIETEFIEKYLSDGDEKV